MEVVGTMFFKNKKLLIDKPVKRNTYQMIGGCVESGETPLMAAIRECREELGTQVKIDENLFELVMEFEEIATSDNSTKIKFSVFIYRGELLGEPKTSFEIESFLWYDSTHFDIPLSNTLKNKVIPYCLELKLIK